MPRTDLVIRAGYRLALHHATAPATTRLAYEPDWREQGQVCSGTQGLLVRTSSVDARNCCGWAQVEGMGANCEVFRDWTSHDYSAWLKWLVLTYHKNTYIWLVVMQTDQQKKKAKYYGIYFLHIIPHRLCQGKPRDHPAPTPTPPPVLTN